MLSLTKMNELAEMRNSVGTGEPISAGMCDAPRTLDARLFLMVNSFETGGTERQFVTLGEELKNGAFQLSLGCISRKGSLAPDVSAVSEFALGGSFYNAQAARSALRLIRYLRGQQISIVHSFDFYTNLLLIPTASLARVPVVIGSHRQLGDLLSPLQFGIQLAAFHLSDCVVCNSRAAAETLVAHGLPKRKIAIIPNAVRREFFSHTVPILARDTSRVRIGLIARMNCHNKGHQLFLRAAQRLSRKHPDVEFILAGDGQNRAEFEELASTLGIANSLRFMGNCQDVRGLLASLDLSVNASTSESQSNSLLESMACGVPVVASAVGGSPEVIQHGETGLLFAPDDVQGLADAMEQLVAKPLFRQQCGERGREFARRNFSADQIRARYSELYERLLVEKRVALSNRTVHSLQPLQPANKLRVAIVAPSLQYVGGQAVQADLLLRSWRSDPDVEAFFIPIDPKFPKYLSWAAKIPYLRTILRAPLYWFTLYRDLAKADVVHVFSASYASFLLAPVPALIIARMLRKSVMINYRSGEAADHLRHSKIAVRLLSQADARIVPSGYLARYLATLASARKSCPT